MSRFRKVARWFMLIAIILAVLFVGWVLVGYWYYVERSVAEPLIHKRTEEVERYLPRFLKDVEELKLTSQWWRGGEEHDAGPYLNPRVTWEYPHVRLKALKRYVKTEKKERKNRKTIWLPAALVDQIHSWGSKWVEHVHDQDLSHYDFSWMKELSKYDHWNIFKNSVYDVIPPEEIFGRGLNTPPSMMPDYRELRAWAQLRLMYGVQKGDLGEALVEVRHLARLVYSNQTFLSALKARLLLVVERRAYDTFKDADFVAVEDWQPIELSDLDKYKRVCMATMGLPLQVYDSLSVFRALEDTDSKLCRCVAVQNVISLLGWFKMEQLQTAFPVGMKELNAFMEKEIPFCRAAPIYKQVWATDEISRWRRERFGEPQGWRVLIPRRIRSWANSIALRVFFAQGGGPMWSDYEKLENQSPKVVSSNSTVP